MNTINALSAINHVGSSTSDSGNRQQSQQQAQPGQFLSATVLESTEGNRFYLDILGNKILAQSDTVTLSPGARLKLEVLATQPQLELRIVSKNPEIFFGKTLTLLEKNLDIGALFQSLQSSQSPLLSQLSSSSLDGLKSFSILQQGEMNTPESGANLKQLLDRLGLSLEAVLAGGNKQQNAGQTLKAALLELSALLKSGGELAETTNKLLGTLELYQLAQLRLSNDNLQIFPLPLPFLDHGYLLVEEDSDNSTEGEDNAPLRFSLHLRLEPLGDIEIRFLNTDEGLYIRFACESKEISDFTSMHQEDLKQMITSTPVLGLSFTEGAGNPARDLIQQLIPDGEAILDTKV